MTWCSGCWSSWTRRRGACACGGRHPALPPGDADLIRGELEPLLRPYDEAAGAYRWEPAPA
ncbi:hypothetical protein [Streptomyces prasinosporus]|uniref:hypothetical protein n=1 Tax=Streptomyces prasinosporus TaxID=68256 RepID=UPI0031ED9B87